MKQILMQWSKKEKSSNIMIDSIFLQHFPNTTLIKIQAIGNGNINDTYLVDYQEDTSMKRTVFQRLNTAIFNEPEKIKANIIAVAKHLRAKNYAYDILDICLTAKNDEWRAFPFFENTYAPLRCDNGQQAELAARLFGHHFAMLSDIEVDKIHTILPHFHDATWRWEQFKTALQNPKLNRDKTAAKEIEFVLKNEFLVTHYQEVISILPPRVTHNDTKITNLLFDNSTQKPRVIIDLDTLQPSTILGEFGDMVRTYCPSHDENEADLSKLIFRKDIFEALKKGFLAEAESIMTKEEIENLSFAGELTIFVQALRFLADYLNGDLYYKTKYAEHNLTRTRNQLHLLEKMRCS